MDHLLVDSPHVFDELSTDGVKLYDNIKAVVDIHTHIESIPPGPVDPKIMPELKVVLNGELRDFGHKKRTLSYAKMQSTKTTRCLFFLVSLPRLHAVEITEF